MQKGATPSPFSLWTVIVLFGLTNAVAFMDRGFLSLVVEPVRLSMKLTDVEIGVLLGPAFILFYSVAALPVGWLADRASRKGIILFGVVFWSICMALTGGSTRFLQLFSARVGIGVGEATLNPAAVSIISDLVPRKHLSSAVAVFIALGSLGAGMGSILGGLLLGWLGRSHGLSGLPIFGALAGWRQAFVILSLPGLALAALMIFVVREPERQRSAHGGGAFAWRQSARYLLTHRRSTLYVMFGFALLSALPAVGAWTPAFLSRTYGWAPARIGPLFGLVQLLTSPSGVVLGGFLADSLRRRGMEDGALYVIAACLAAAVPFLLLFPFMPTGEASLMIFAPANLLTMVCFGASSPMIPLIVPQGMRGQAVAIMFLMGNLVGGLGPLIIPLTTQYLFRDPSGLRYAILVIPLFICPCVVLILLGLRTAFRDQLMRLRQAAQERQGLPDMSPKPGPNGGSLV